MFVFGECSVFQIGFSATLGKEVFIYCLFGDTPANQIEEAMSFQPEFNPSLPTQRLTCFSFRIESVIGADAI